ncbi:MULTISPECIES: hypothetical protein [Shewanella]|uniref:TolC family protein n=2 Tax=Unclassified Bacteria TaxID=49928 RepID=A0AAU6VS76_UNCXX|nr:MULTISPECIES: hypothetical protein [Shewanella]MCT8979821.1 hypothetical protein [Shewanella algae]MDE0565674.1 hypothetical protein [Shewanella sp. K8]
MKLTKFAWLLLWSLAVQPAFAADYSFASAWQQLLEVSDKLAAEGQEVSRAEAQQEAGRDLNLPSLNINGSRKKTGQPDLFDVSHRLD